MWARREAIVDIDIEIGCYRTVRYVIYNVAHPKQLYQERGLFQLYETRQIADEKLAELNKTA